MTTRSGPRAVAGLLLALALPLFYLTLAKLIEGGVITFERTGLVFETINSLGLSAMAQIVLSLIGVWMTGTALGLRTAGPWLALYLFGLPALAFAWFMGFALFGGATGSPF